ncbi:MAG: glucose 1-dehydrogenase [Gammaproteobacteria bacterium]|nr:glucose 1-dehydrogenase [Gammaproteobacteria bacterium]
MNRLDGKVALISGAARGIGAATATRMAEAGARIMIGDILEERAQETLAAIRGAGGEVEFIKLDVTREADWQAAVEATVKRFGELSVLVNNAGAFNGRDIESSTLEDWNRLCSVNLTGVFLGTKLAAPALREAAPRYTQGSAIVNLASIAGLVGSQLDPLYSMTKGGVTTFTKSAALEFARKGYRIRVNSIHPGVIETDMGAQTFVARAANMSSNDVEQARSIALSTHPIGRLGTADDIAKGIVFLASEDSGFMTGAGLVVDGGLTAQ